MVSGPSGAGKDAVLARVKGSGKTLNFVVTATTRSQREGESDGAPYHFVSRERFQEMVEGGELLEWAEVYGNLYGVPRRRVKEALERGHDVLVKVDVQGAATIKRAVPQALLIFLAPPSTAALEERLRDRSTESAAELERRIATAHEEMKQQGMFDHVVVNDEVEIAAAEIDAIIATEKRRPRPRAVNL